MVRLSLGASSWIVMPRGDDDLALGDRRVGRRELRRRRGPELLEVATTPLLAPRPLALRAGAPATAGTATAGTTAATGTAAAAATRARRADRDHRG